MTTYNDMHTVTLTLSDWLTIKLALQTAVDSYHVQECPLTAKDVDSVALRIAKQNHAALETARLANKAHVERFLQHTA